MAKKNQSLNNPLHQPKGLEGLAQNIILTFKDGTQVSVVIPARIKKGGEIEISKIEVTTPYKLPKGTVFKPTGPNLGQA